MLLQLLRKYLQATDEDLVRKFKSSGEAYYAGVLFKRYNEMTISLALNYLKNEHDAEDAVMDCYEILYRDLKKAEVKDFGGWYYTVVRNYLLKVKRQKNKVRNDELIEGYHDRTEEDSGFKVLFNHKEEKIKYLVSEVLKTLKPVQEKCIRAFYIERKSYKEIAMILNLSDKEVKSHLQNGKRKLLVELEKRNVKSVREIS